MCEFTGLDFEMEIHEHYFEVLDVVDRLFVAIFKGLQVRYGAHAHHAACRKPKTATLAAASVQSKDVHQLVVLCSQAVSPRPCGSG